MTRFGLVTAEIVDPIFSGNGVASRSVARCLLRRPEDSLLVVCGQPAGPQVVPGSAGTPRWAGAVRARSPLVLTPCRAQEEPPGADSCADLLVERVDAELAAAVGAIARVRACAPASVRTC
jgi:hypothetical protein